MKDRTEAGWAHLENYPRADAPERRAARRRLRAFLEAPPPRGAGLGADWRAYQTALHGELGAFVNAVSQAQDACALCESEASTLALLPAYPGARKRPAPQTPGERGLATGLQAAGVTRFAAAPGKGQRARVARCHPCDLLMSHFLGVLPGQVRWASRLTAAVLDWFAGRVETPDAIRKGWGRRGAPAG